MNRIVAWLALTPLMAASSAAPSQTPPACDRACMKSTLDTYLQAVVKHDAAAARLAVGYRHTENAIDVPRGKGNWYENGTKVTGRRNGDNDDCVSGLQGFDLANVAARRIPLVDDEQGVVLGMAVFIRKPGTPAAAATP